MKVASTKRSGLEDKKKKLEPSDMLDFVLKSTTSMIMPDKEYLAIDALWNISFDHASMKKKRKKKSFLFILNCVFNVRLDTLFRSSI